MLFLDARCPTCGLDFKVIATARDRTVQVPDAAWRLCCLRAVEVQEARMCHDLRAAAFAAGNPEPKAVKASPPR